MKFEEIMAREGFIPNEEQRKVIETTANTVVAAGAGTGKTEVLSWRFLRLVMEKGVSPDQILTITFTRKAANEMRMRIYARLLQAKDSLPEDCLKRFTNAEITTMDSFWASVAKSDLISYGLARDITVLDDKASEEITLRLARKFLNNPALATPLGCCMMPSEVEEGFFRIIADNVSVTGNYNAASITAAFMASVTEEYRRRREIIASAFAALSSLELSPKFKETLDAAADAFEKEQLTEDLYLSRPCASAREIVNEIKPIFGKGSGYCALQDLVKNGSSSSDLQVCVEEFASMLIAEKKRLGALSFNDISDLALATLRDNLEIRKIFSRRYKYVMVDEFQDNNRKQKDLLYLLADERFEPGVPTTAEIAKEKLFFVGDEKQSIYRFRGADVSVFRKLQEEIGMEGCNLPLSTNYRSEPALIDHFNSVFSNVLSSAENSYDARYSEIRAGRKPCGFEPKVIFGVVKKGDNLADSADVIEAEAVGNYCTRMLESDEFLVPDRKTGALRRPLPSEIGILLRSTGNQLNIEKALKKRGISYQVTDNKSLMFDAVASDFYVLINSILYPEDRKSLVALLRSPFCGLTEKEILEGKYEDSARYSAFSAFFNSVREAAFRLTVPELLEKIYICGGYRDYLAAHSEFTEHYEYLFSYASDMDAAGKGLTDFALFLRTYLGTNEGKMPETVVLHREKTGVQIMTVHKSKGLDFPIVIFADTGRDTPNSKGKYVFNYNGNLVASRNRKILSILESEESSKEEAELRRVMYVAFTRARTHLVTTGTYGLTKENDISAGPIFRWYADAIDADLEKLSCAAPVKLEKLNETAVMSAERSSVSSARIPDASGEFVSKPHRISVSELSDSSVSDSGIRLPESAADEIITELGLQDGFGTLCHKVLEELIGKGSYEGVECGLCEKSTDNEVLLKQARGFADSFINSDFYKEFVAGRRCEEEVRYYAPCSDSCAVEGVIDLIVFGEKENLVVDYKTDRVKNPEAHRSQLTSYISAAEDIYGKPCRGALFYLRSPEDAVFI